MKVRNTSSKWIKRWEAHSFTDPNTVYTVSKDREEHFACSCKAWIFQRKKLPDGHCKHINVILAKLQVDAQETVNEQMRSMLDEWAIEEVFSMPNLGIGSFDERTI